MTGVHAAHCWPGILLRTVLFSPSSRQAWGLVHFRMVQGTLIVADVCFCVGDKLLAEVGLASCGW